MTQDKTERGFAVRKFIDANGQRCSVQESSATNMLRDPGKSFLWLGVQGYRMHLSRNEVIRLTCDLATWATEAKRVVGVVVVDEQGTVSVLPLG